MVDSYATGNDLIARHDVDLVGDLATDERETLPRAAIPSHNNVLKALSGASGEVNSALIVGAKYTPDDLVALEGMDREYLVDLVCDLAMIRLYRRRGESIPDHLRDIRDEINTKLEMLRKGMNIFNIPETVDATLLDLDGPTPVELEHRNDITVRMERYFPTTDTRLPRRQGGRT